MAIFPVGIPYSLPKPNHAYCRNFSLRVATLVWPIASAPRAAQRLLVWNGSKIFAVQTQSNIFIM